MYIISKKGCQNYKLLGEDETAFFQLKSLELNCKNCVYFSSRNCLMNLEENSNFN